MSANQVAVVRPRAWPWLLALLTLSLGWAAYCMYGNYQHWQATGLMEPMGNKIRNGVLTVGALLALGYAAVWGSSLLGHSGRKDAVGAHSANTRVADGEVAPARAILSASGARYVLEVRGLGMVVNRDADDEIWQQIEQKADNFSSFLSGDASDYADSADSRLSDYSQVERIRFPPGSRSRCRILAYPDDYLGTPAGPQKQLQGCC